MKVGGPPIAHDLRGCVQVVPERAGRGEAGMIQPETKYTKIGDSSIAYQVMGDGPVDLGTR